MVCTKMPAYFIATAHSMIIDMLDSRGVFGSANNATCILRRGFCTSVLNGLSWKVTMKCTQEKVGDRFSLSMSAG